MRKTVASLVLVGALSGAGLHGYSVTQAQRESDVQTQILDR